MFHSGDIGQSHLQLRVSQRFRGPKVRVQGPGRLVRADESAPDDGDGVDRRRCDRRSVPGDSSLLRRVGAPAPTSEGAAVLGGARPGAAGGGGGAARSCLAVQGSRAGPCARPPLGHHPPPPGQCNRPLDYYPVYIVSGVHIDRLCVKLCRGNKSYEKNLCDNYFTKFIIYFEGISFVYTDSDTFGRCGYIVKIQNLNCLVFIS